MSPEKKIDQSLDRDTVRIHDLTIDPARYQTIIEGKELSLSYSEFYFLYMLVRYVSKVCTRYQIINALYGYDYIVSDRAVDVQMKALRKKIEPLKY